MNGSRIEACNYLTTDARVVVSIGGDDATDPRARKLFSRLPYAFRLHSTRTSYPHVLNQLAADWGVPRRFLALMNHLLLDFRGGRQGFTFETVVELTNLREYYVNEVHPELRTNVTRRDPSVWF